MIQWKIFIKDIIGVDNYVEFIIKGNYNHIN